MVGHPPAPIRIYDSLDTSIGCWAEVNLFLQPRLRAFRLISESVLHIINRYDQPPHKVAEAHVCGGG
jgi:hypothetical protein